MNNETGIVASPWELFLLEKLRKVAKENRSLEQAISTAIWALESPNLRGGKNVGKAIQILRAALKTKPEVIAATK